MRWQVIPWQARAPLSFKDLATIKLVGMPRSSIVKTHRPLLKCVSQACLCLFTFGSAATNQLRTHTHTHTHTHTLWGCLCLSQLTLLPSFLPFFTWICCATDAVSFPFWIWTRTPSRALGTRVELLISPSPSHTGCAKVVARD